ncbi:MAG: hybrid sensor histidine kinase/response regulator [Pseudomonadota bacterium]
MNDRQYNIMIVDDEPLNLKTLGAHLKTDYEILVAKNGEQALKLAFAALRPDLILLDIMMPGMDGYEVCRRLKADPRTQNIPIIFISAMSNEMDETKGLKLGAVDYITKPISLPILMTRVKNHLKLKRAYEELENKNKALEEAAILRDNVDRIIQHDLKTPLNGIIGFSSLLHIKYSKLDEQQRKKIIKEIEKSGYKMLEMINLFLNLYKMETGTYQYSPEPVDILPVLKRIVNETKHLADAKGLSFKMAVNNQPVTDKFIAQGERLLCYSMLANLFKNAIEASPKTGPLTVSLFNEKESTAIISIHNQGAVPREIREKFFDKYVTAGKSGGTGLGTYSAKLMAETQEGSIQFETSEETGTTVTVHLVGVQDYEI